MSIENSLIRTVLFTLAGAALGYLYYRFVGCSTGTCPITSSARNSMLYMGFLGFLISQS